MKASGDEVICSGKPPREVGAVEANESPLFVEPNEDADPEPSEEAVEMFLRGEVI